MNKFDICEKIGKFYSVACVEVRKESTSLEKYFVNSILYAYRIHFISLVLGQKFREINTHIG